MSTPAAQPESSRFRHVPQISDGRRQTVETARQVWIRKLIDLSRRNNLLYYRPLKTGTLELSAAPIEKLRNLVGGESVPASKLAPDVEDEVLSEIISISKKSAEYKLNTIREREEIRKYYVKYRGREFPIKQALNAVAPKLMRAGFNSDTAGKPPRW